MCSPNTLEVTVSNYDIEAEIVEERVFRVGNKTFKSKQDAIEYRQTRLLEDFVQAIWGKSTPNYYGQVNDSVTALVLAKQSGDHIGRLQHYLKTVLTREGKEIPEDGLVNLDLSNDPRVNQDVATELFLEVVWRVMIGQKTISRNSFKKKVQENPDFFYKGLNDLAEIYAWQQLAKTE